MKKALSLFLVVLMLVGMLPMTALNASAAAGDYVKVTAEPADWSGTYLIVYEAGNVAFNGGLSTLDAVSNTVAVSIADGVIAGSETLKAATFTIDSNGYIKSASGYYIGQTSNANGLKSSQTTTYANTISINADGSVNFVSGGAYLRYNSASDQLRFRYYKSSSYTNQKAICLYKLEEAASGGCDHNYVEEVTSAATCTEAGEKTHTCSLCGDSYTTTIAALGHTWGDWSETTAPTCTDAGAKERACSVCGTTESGVIAATGHSYADGACSVCGVAAPAAVAYKISSADAFVSGEYVMVVSGYAPGVYEDGWLTAVQPAIDGDSIVDAAGGIWTLTVDGTTVKIVDANGVSVAPKAAATNGITSGDYSWTWAVNEDGTFTFAGEQVKLASNVQSSYKFRAYKDTTISGNTSGYLANFSLYKVASGSDEGGDIETPEACTHTNTTTTTVDATCTEAGSTTVVCDDCGETVSTEEIAALGHNIVDNVCERCGAEFEGEIDTPDETEPTDPSEPTEEVKIIFELGDNGSATHNDGKSATTYTETVGEYTLSITGGVKMYTGAIDATGNGCIKLGTGSAVGGFTFTVPSDVTKVVICVAKYKANTTKFNVNGTEYTLSNASNDGAYDEIIVDTSSTKTVTVTTVSGGYRAMVNSIAYICGETDHTCQWDEGTVTTAATCTTDGVLTYSCTVDGCTITMTETIKATGHNYTYVDGAMTCTCGDSKTISPISDAKAYTDKTVVYYVKGIVTYVSADKVYIEDETGAILIFFDSAVDTSGIALGDEIVVWDTMTTYNGLIETTYTLETEYLKVSSGNELPSQTVTIADLLADTTNEYLAERVVIENVTIGTINTSGNTALTDADGNSINIYKVSGLSEDINENDTVTVTAILSTYNGYQLLINPGTAATDVVETVAGEEEVVTTVTIAEAKAGTEGEYYQVEGIVTYVAGRNVYIQDETGAIVVYLTSASVAPAVGDKVKARGTLDNYNGLLELTDVNTADANFFQILSSGNTVEPQEVTIADLLAATNNDLLAERVTLKNVYISYYSYNSSYGNVTYTLLDVATGETIKINRVTVASEAECYAAGSLVNLEANVSAYVSDTTEGNGYQLVTDNSMIEVLSVCIHESTELVNAVAATCTEAGYTGDTQCTVCKYYVSRGEDIAALGHTEVVDAAVAATCTETGLTEGSHCSVCNEVIVAQEEVAALGHTEVETEVAPTCTEQGYTLISCSVCGHEVKEDFADALGHTLVDGVCSVCNYNESLNINKIGLSFQDYIGLNFRINKPTGYDSVYAITSQVTWDNTNKVFTTVEKTLQPIASGTKYYIFDQPVLANAMTEQVTVTVYAEKDGVVYKSETVVTSVQEQAIVKCAALTTSAPGSVEILVNMLNYGATLQTRFSHNTDNLPDAGEYASYASDSIEDLTATSSTTGTGAISIDKIGLSMQDKVELQARMVINIADADKYEVRYTVEGDSEVHVIDGANFVSGNSSGSKCIARIAVKAQNMRKMYTIEVYEKETETCVSAAYLYSVEALGQAQLGTVNNDLIIALMKYGDSVANNL